jgi:hypothetical protein
MSEETGLLDNVPEAAETPDANSEAAQAAGIEHQAQETFERPDWLPENFFDAKKGPNYENLAKSYSELRQQFSQGKHKAPEGGAYDIKLFADKGVKEDDAALKVYKDWATEHGISQKAFDSLAEKMLGMASENVAPVFDMAAERKALGPNADALIKGTAEWGRNLVRKGVWSPEDYDEFRVFAGTAAGLRAAMKLREAYEGRIPDLRDTPSGGQMTEQELQGMVGDPRYLSDPAYRQKVERAFEQFYGGKAA